MKVEYTDANGFELCNMKVQGTFATAGSDGAFNFWDKDSKQRLKVLSCLHIVLFPLIHDI